MQTSQLEQRHRRFVVIAIVVVGIVVGGLLLRRFEPSNSAFYLKCVLHELTGLHCPGCGATRALGALTHGRFAEAVRFNPMLVLGGPVIFAVLWYQRRRESNGATAAPKLAWCLFAILMFYFVARNIPSPQQSWLAPPTALPTVESE